MSEKEIKRILISTLKQLFGQKGIKLNKLILFGSYSMDKATESSDIDLVIVSENFRNKNLSERIKMMLGVNRQLVNALDKPVDTVFYSDKEWEQENSLIINEAKQYGTILL